MPDLHRSVGVRLSHRGTSGVQIAAVTSRPAQSAFNAPNTTIGLLRCNTMCEAKIGATYSTPDAVRFSAGSAEVIMSEPGAGPVAVTIASLPIESSYAQIVGENS